MMHVYIHNNQCNCFAAPRGSTIGSSIVVAQMPSILGRACGLNGGISVGVLGLRSASFSGGARAGKLVRGVASLLKPVASNNRSIAGRRKNTAAYRGKLGNQSTPWTTNGRKPPDSPSGRLHFWGSMRPASRHAVRCTQGKTNKKMKAASGAKGRVVKRCGVGAVTSPMQHRRLCSGTHRKPPQRPVKAATGRVGDVELIVGLAQENDATHADRHPLSQIDLWAKKCTRCFFARWKRTHQTPPWLNSKPSFMKGAWGLGCIWCAASRHSTTVQSRRRAHMRLNKDAGHCKQAVSRASKWSAYTQRQLGSTSALHMAIHQHQATDLHRLSDNCFHSPAAHLDNIKDPRGPSLHRVDHSYFGAPVRQELMQPRAHPTNAEGGRWRLSCTERTPESTGYSALGSTTDPFRGRVPQIQDWLDVWADSTSALSI